MRGPSRTRCPWCKQLFFPDQTHVCQDTNMETLRSRSSRMVIEQGEQRRSIRTKTEWEEGEEW